LLNSHRTPFRYRDYKNEPLSQAELRRVLKMLGLGPKDVLRKNDRAFKELGLSGDEPDRELIRLMAQHPTLLQRPIGVLEGSAVVGRPPEKLLRLLD
jgi:arsenate reductase